MTESFYFPTFSGLLTEEHREKIGPALWEFLWCISSTTKEIIVDGETLGVVYGGKPVSYNEVAKKLGGSKSTVKRNFEKLEEHGYIDMKRTPYGHIITVKNSKKFKDSAKNGTSAEYSTGAKNDSRGAIFGGGGAENGHSNKDIELDIKDINNAAVYNAREESTGGVPTTESVQLADADQSKGQIPGSSLVNAYESIKNTYMRLAVIGGFDISAKDRMSIQKLLSYNIDTDKVLIWLEECFRDYKPKHQFDKINSFAYCLPIILDKYFAEQEVEKSGKPKHKRSTGKASSEDSITGGRVGWIRPNRKSI